MDHGQPHEAHPAPDHTGPVQTLGDRQDPFVGGNLHDQGPCFEGVGRGEDLVSDDGEGAGGNKHEEADCGTQPHDFPV